MICGGTTTYTNYEITYRDVENNNRKFSFSSVGKLQNEDYYLAVAVANYMESILLDDFFEIIAKYMSIDNISIRLSFKSNDVPQKDETGSYDNEIADVYSKWILDTKKGVKLYNIYDFIVDEASNKDSVIKISMIIKNDSDYNSFNTYREKILNDFRKKVGSKIGVELVVE